MNCDFKACFTKLAKIHAKNGFSFAIIAGDLFGEASTEADLAQITALLHGTIIVPLPVYFTLAKHKLPEIVVEKLKEADEVCPNLYYLGRRGTVKTSEGVKIVALGGSFQSENLSEAGTQSKYEPSYTDADARALRGANSADILITNDWPKSIAVGSKVQLPEDTPAPEGTQSVADTCAILRPRYHFSSSPSFFYEREPFFHPPSDDSPEVKPITRFLSMAAFGNASGQKWLYAFNLDTTAGPPVALPLGTTASPLTQPARKRRSLPNQQESFSRFSGHDNYQRDNYRPKKRARQPPPTPSECFFCLSNANVATHLITSIGTNVYLTTAKGPLTTPDTFPELGFTSHILIIPLEHSPTLFSIADPATKTATYQEIQRYRQALHSMLEKKAKGRLAGVTWEISRAEGVHLQWQFLPVPVDLVNRGLVEAAFKVEAENLQYPAFETRVIGDGTAEKGDYFRVMIWSPPTGKEEQTNGDKGSNGDLATTNGDAKGTEKELILPLQPGFRFDLQFARRVLAKLLSLEPRTHWKDAVLPHVEEEKDAEAFKDAFREFDFSLTE